MGILKASNLNKIPIFMNVSKNVIELNSKVQMIQLTYIYTTTTVIKLATKMIDGITSSFSKDEFLLSEIKPDILFYCKSI